MIQSYRSMPLGGEAHFFENNAFHFLQKKTSGYNNSLFLEL